MKKSLGMIPKILSGEKTIESRWYLNKSQPWKNISQGDKVFFKNSGEPVTVEAVVSKFSFFENLTPEKIDELFIKYGKGICLTENIYHDKKYCILIFLKNPKSIKPFDINKTGFGAMSAWIVANDIKKIQR